MAKDFMVHFCNKNAVSFSRQVQLKYSGDTEVAKRGHGVPQTHEKIVPALLYKIHNAM